MANLTSHIYQLIYKIVGIETHFRAGYRPCVESNLHKEPSNTSLDCTTHHWERLLPIRGILHSIQEWVFESLFHCPDCSLSLLAWTLSSPLLPTLQVEALQKDVFKANAAKVAEFEADKPRLKSLLQALNENRLGLKKEVARLQAIVAKGQGMAPSGQPGQMPGTPSSFLHAESRAPLITRSPFGIEVPISATVIQSRSMGGLHWWLSVCLRLREGRRGIRV